MWDVSAVYPNSATSDVLLTRGLCEDQHALKITSAALGLHLPDTIRHSKGSA
jgi:hypothetical protein